MNENKGVVWLYTLITALIAGISSAFYAILVKYYYEADTGMFRVGFETPDAFSVFVAVGLLTLLVSVLIMSKDGLPKEMGAVPFLTTTVAIFAAFVLVFSSVRFLTGNTSDIIGSASAVQKIRKIGAFAGFPAACYYFLLMFVGKTKNKTIAFMSFFPLIWTWIYLLGVYFDHSSEMSSPIRVIKELALISLMLYQLMETRALVGKAKPRAYILISGIAVMFLSPAFLIDAYDYLWLGESLKLDALHVIYGALMAIYIFSRMIGFALGCGEKRVKIKKHRKGDIFTEEEDVPEQENKPTGVAEFFEEVKEEPAVQEQEESEAVEKAEVQEQNEQSEI